MGIANYASGLNHIGIPTKCYEKTKQFYQELGCKPEYETILKDVDQKVVFLKSGNLLLEVYEEKETAGQSGAINHFSFDCSDIEKAFDEAHKSGYKIVSDGIEALPFWEKGVRFFIILGPNEERVEFCQRL